MEGQIGDRKHRLTDGVGDARTYLKSINVGTFCISLNLKLYNWVLFDLLGPNRSRLLRC